MNSNTLMNNSKTIVYIFAAIAAVIMLFGGLVQQASAIKVDEACNGVGAQNSAICASKDENIGNNFAASITNTFLFVLGIIAVIMIIFGGIRYATANGEPANITAAKNIILYSVVGLVVALMAWGIVSFVAQRFGGTTPQNTNQQATP